MSLRPLDATTKDISPLRTCKFKELGGACLGDPQLWRGHMSGRFLNHGMMEILKLDDYKGPFVLEALYYLYYDY